MAAGQYVADYNLVYGTPENRNNCGVYPYCRQGLHSIFGSPVFINAGAGDYHLKAGSPGYGAGNSAVATATDMQGRSRGKAPDIGALQTITSNVPNGSGAAAPSTPPPAANPSAPPSSTPTPAKNSSGASSSLSPNVLNLLARKGTPTVSGVVSLSSAIKGAKKITYSIDGKPLDSNQLDTQKLADGEHTVEAKIIKDNGQVVTEKRKIRVDNDRGFVENVVLRYGKGPSIGSSMAILVAATVVLWRIFIRPRYIHDHQWVGPPLEVTSIGKAPRPNPKANATLPEPGASIPPEDNKKTPEA